MSFNLVILMGNLTRDPEIRYTPKGTAVADFGLAVNEVWFTANGEKREEVSFVDVTCWEKSAEWSGKFLKKGCNVHVTGKLKMETWDDKQTGKKMSKLKVIAQKLTPCFATWKDGSKPPPSDDDARPSAQTPAQRQPPAKREEEPMESELQPQDEDSSPF